MLDTFISLKKYLAIALIRNLKYVFYNRKLSITIKTHVFNFYVASTFLCNSELRILINRNQRISARDAKNCAYVHKKVQKVRNRKV